MATLVLLIWNFLGLDASCALRLISALRLAESALRFFALQTPVPLM